ISRDKYKGLYICCNRSSGAVISTFSIINDAFKWIVLYHRHMFIGGCMIDRLYIIEIQYSKQVRFIGDITNDSNDFNVLISRSVGLLDGQLLMNTIQRKLGQL